MEPLRPFKFPASFILLLALALILTGVAGCKSSPPEPEVDPAPSYEPKDSAEIAGYWVGVICQRGDQETARAALLDVGDDGLARLVYCEIGKTPDELPGGTGLAEFHITSMGGRTIELSMHNWSYQTAGNPGLLPESCTLSLAKADSQDERYDSATGIVLDGTTLRGELKNKQGEYAADAAFVRPESASYLAPGWIWKYGSQYPHGIIGVWAPWFGSTSGMDDNILLYKDEHGSLRMRSARGWLDLPKDYNGDGAIDLRIEQSMADYFGLDANQSPFVSTFYSLNAATGTLNDISSNFKDFYLKTAAPALLREVSILRNQATPGDEDSDRSHSLAAFEQVLAATRALYRGELSSGTPRSIFRYSVDDVESIG